MPTFEFTSPEGKKYEVNGPDGATKEQAEADKKMAEQGLLVIKIIKCPDCQKAGCQ